jgi:hypothetical protein
MDRAIKNSKMKSSWLKNGPFGAKNGQNPGFVVTIQSIGIKLQAIDLMHVTNNWRVIKWPPQGGGGGGRLKTGDRE